MHFKFMKNNKIIKKKYDCISFDIFDTLIKRLVDDPKEIFKIVEYRYQCLYYDSFIDDFFGKRILAERKARNDYRREISLDEIYAALNSENQYSKEVINRYINLEIATEISFSIVNKQGKELYEAARVAGKRIIITSDMYLPYDMIVKLLDKSGYKDYSNIYLSNNIKKTKANGDIYKFILENEKIIGRKLLHIGDDLRSDILKARLNGVKAKRIKKEKSKGVGGINARVLNNFLKNSGKDKKNDFVNFIGYNCFGPMLYGFVNWLDNHFKNENYDKIIFLSRDGWIMKQAFEIASANHPYDNTEYFYASRRALQVAAMCVDPSYESMIGSMFFPRTFDAKWIVSKWGLVFDNISSDIFNACDIEVHEQFSAKNVAENEKLKKLYEHLKSDIIENSQKEHEAFIKYLKEKQCSGKVALIDIGWFGNMQHAIEKICSNTANDLRIDGYYLGIVPTTHFSSASMKGYIYSKSKNEELFDKSKTTNSLLELFFMAPHGSLKKYVLDSQGDVSFEFKQFEYEGTETFDLFKAIQASALQFIQDFANAGECIFNDELTYTHNFFECFLNPDTYTAKTFGDVMVLDESWRYIAKNTKSIFNVKAFMAEFANVSWKIGYLKRVFKIKMPYCKILTAMRKMHLKRSNKCN